MMPIFVGKRLRSRGLAGFIAVLVLAWGCGETSQSTSPPSPAASPFVDIAWLQERLGEGDVRVVDARVAAAQFEAGHIPGALRLEPYELSATVNGISAQVAPREIVEPLISASGLRPDQTIVVYGKPPEYDPTRVAWVLRYYGYPDVRYLDGGWDAWEGAGLEVESGPGGEPGEGQLPDVMVDDLRVTGDWILERLGEPPYRDPTIQLIDARSQAEYDAGRIPGAIHLRWTINLDDGYLLPPADLEALYADLDKTKTTVVYCLAGWRASLSWLVLESLGFEDVRVYDGSWIEWGQGGRFPIETG